MNIIKAQLSEFSGVKIEIIYNDENKNSEKFDDDVDEIKKIFGEDIVIIK